MAFEAGFKHSDNLRKVGCIEALGTPIVRPLVPYLLNGILRGVVRRKGDQGTRPIVGRETSIQAGSKVGTFSPSLPTGIVPTDRERRGGMPREQFGQAIGRCRTFGFGRGQHGHFPGVGIDGAIQRLSLFGIATGPRQALAAFPPGGATEIAPQQETLVQKKEYPLLAFERGLMGLDRGGQFGPFGRDDRRVFLGFVACAFVWLRPAA